MVFGVLQGRRRHRRERAHRRGRRRGDPPAVAEMRDAGDDGAAGGEPERGLCSQTRGGHARRKVRAPARGDQSAAGRPTSPRAEPVSEAFSRTNGECQMTTRPKIVISSLDAARLEAMLASLRGEAFPGKEELEEELARATIVDPKDMPPTVVTMNSTVRFRVESSSAAFNLTLVYPKDIDSSGTKISILAPVGSALLGLSQGDEIEWPKPGGGVLRVHIEEVTYQPERAGQYSR
jgi:regulator of nucleoside diphosphate kinase